MFTWNVENMALLNEPKRIFYGKEGIYSYEIKTSREDKIAFVDSLQDGKLSYLLGLIEKFNAEKDSMPKDGWGTVKTTSLKAWIKRNDIRYKFPIINDDYNYGKYRFVGCERYIQHDSAGKYDTYDDLVDEIFHRQLKECEKMEKKYFQEHDEYSILKKRAADYSHQYHTTFGTNPVFSSSGEIFVYDGDNDRREITMEELKILIDKYEKLEGYIEELTAEVTRELEQDDRER